MEVDISKITARVIGKKTGHGFAGKRESHTMKV